MIAEDIAQTGNDAPSVIGFYRTASMEELIRKADAVCRQYHSNKVWLRGLIEFSNYCAMDCQYCGIRRSNSNVHRYRLTEDEIVITVQKGLEAGLRTFVLQSGEDPFFTTDRLCRLVERIKNTVPDNAAITLSCGIKTKAQFRALKNSGVDRYLMRFETSDRQLYAKLRNGVKLEDRVRALYDLKDLGYETGSGYMVGLPGETEDIRISNALLCRKLSLDMVGVGPFIPHPDTPLFSAAQMPIELAVRATALLRLLLPLANIPATTAAGTLDPMGREKMIEAGANVLMPNITPVEHKKDYLLYPNKICIGETGFECLGCLSSRVALSGKVLDFGRGNSLGRAFIPETRRGDAR